MIIRARDYVIGKIFLKKGILTNEQLDEVYDYSLSHNKKFASSSIELGYVTEKEALICLTEQIGFPGIELLNSKFKIYKDLIPFEIAIKEKILPLKVFEKSIIMGIPSPANKVLIDEVSFWVGKKVIAYLAVEDILVKVIEEVYNSDKTYYEPKNYQFKEPFLSVISPSVISFIDGEEKTDDFIVGEFVNDKFCGVCKNKSHNEKEKNVLIVDDDDDILNLVSKVVEKLKMKPITVNNGNDAIGMITQYSPDLVILDAMLPGKHGFEICKEIKESENFSSIPVLIISAIYKGWQFEKDIVGLYKADKFLEKPFRISVLIETIKELTNSEKSKNIIGHEQKLEDILILTARLINNADYINAQKTLEEAVRTTPFYYKFRYLLGYTYLALENKYLAISELEAAVSINKKFFPAIKELAILYEKMGFRNKAIEKWQIAIEASEDESVKEKIKNHLMGLVSSI